MGLHLMKNFSLEKTEPLRGSGLKNGVGVLLPCIACRAIHIQPLRGYRGVIAVLDPALHAGLFTLNP